MSKITKSYIQIILEPRYVSNPPQADIYINDKKLKVCKFTETNIPVTFNFEIDLLHENFIVIHRHSKTNRDTVMLGEETISDQTLHIKNILIDKVPMESLLHLGIFYPDYPEPWATQQRVQGIKLPTSETYRSNLYHNGTWHFKFENPIHPWFFTKINISI
jgi:hypothetical protein